MILKGNFVISEKFQSDQNECKTYSVFMDYLIDDEIWIKIYAKNDGCIHIDFAKCDPFCRLNRTDKYDEKIHLCDIDSMITFLTNLKNELNIVFDKN